jgi:hypothetical protein
MVKRLLRLPVMPRQDAADALPVDADPPQQQQEQEAPQSETERFWAAAAAAVRAEADAAARHDAWLATAATLPPGALAALQPSTGTAGAGAMMQQQQSATSGAVEASPAMAALREARRAEREAGDRVAWQLRAALGV